MSIFDSRWVPLSLATALDKYGFQPALKLSESVTSFKSQLSDYFWTSPLRLSELFFMFLAFSVCVF